MSGRTTAKAPPAIACASRISRLGDPAIGRRPAVPCPLVTTTSPAGALLLHLHDEGEDHRPAVETLEISPQCLADLLLHLRRVGARLGVDGSQRLEDGAPRPLEDVRARLLPHDPAGDEVGPGDDLARLLGDRQHGEHEAVLGEVAAVAQHLVLDVADALPVDEDAAGGYPLGPPGAARRVELEHVAVLEEMARLRGDPDLHRQAVMADEMAVLAVHRHEVARADQVHHELQLFLRGVPGDVDGRSPAVVHDGAPPVEMVHQARDGALVARDDARGEDHHVARVERHRLVRVQGDADERRGGLGLAARGDEHDLIAREVARRARVDERTVGDGEMAEVARDGGMHTEAPADEGDTPAEPHGQVDDLRHAVDVRREGRDEDPAGRLPEDRLQLRTDAALRRRHARLLDVGRVREQEQHALGAEFPEPDEVGQPSVERRLVDLEVTGVDDGADGCPDRETDGVRDGMRHRDRLDDEGPDATRLGAVRQQRRRKAALAKALADEAERQRRPVDRHGPLGERVGQRADVVLVGMGQHDRLEPFPEAADVAEIGDRDVDAEHALVREHDAAVDRDRRLAVLEDEHVEADLAEPAERDHAERGHRTSMATRRPAATSCGGETCSRRNARTRRTSSSRSTPATGIGAPTTTSMSPEAIRHVPRGSTLSLCRTAIGTIGTPVSSAIMNPPFLKGRRWPSGPPRVPSGKIITEMPSPIRRSAARRLRPACAESPRAMLMWPLRRSAQPKTGTRVSSTFATQRSWNAGRATMTASTSNWLRGCGMKTQGGYGARV